MCGILFILGRLWIICFEFLCFSSKSTGSKSKSEGATFTSEDFSVSEEGMVLYVGTLKLPVCTGLDSGMSVWIGGRSRRMCKGMTLRPGLFAIKLGYSDRGIICKLCSSSFSVMGGNVGGQNLVKLGAVPPCFFSSCDGKMNFCNSGVSGLSAKTCLDTTSGSKNFYSILPKRFWNQVKFTIIDLELWSMKFVPKSLAQNLKSDTGISFRGN